MFVQCFFSVIFGLQLHVCVESYYKYLTDLFSLEKYALLFTSISRFRPFPGLVNAIPWLLMEAN